MTDLTDLTQRYQQAMIEAARDFDNIATTLAKGIGELGEPRALEAAYLMARSLDLERLEHLLVTALITAAREKTGAQLRGRTLRNKPTTT